nr:uncharacterized protein LOC129272860 [Lytechinus pictus]
MPISSTRSPPNTTRSQYRIKRSQLRLIRSGRNEQTSDSNSSRDVSLRSSGVAMSSDASTASITCSVKPSSVPQPRLLGRRGRCETPVPREDADDLSDVDNQLTKEDTLNQRCRLDNLVNEPDVDLLHQRLPSIDQRPVSRHVVYTVQYDGKKDDKTKSSSTMSAIVSSSFDSPRTLRAKAMQKDLRETVSMTKLSRQDRDIKVKFARTTFPSDDFVDECTKNRILSWLENVETAQIEDSIDSKTLTAIQEEAL